MWQKWTVCWGTFSVNSDKVQSITWNNTISSNSTHWYSSEHCLQRKREMWLIWKKDTHTVHMDVTATCVCVSLLETSFYLREHIPHHVAGKVRRPQYLLCKKGNGSRLSKYYKWGTCGSEVERVVGRSAVWSLAPPVHMLKCPRTRY